VLHGKDWRRDPVRRVRNRLGDFTAEPGARLEAAVLAARPDLVHTHNLPGISTAVWGVAARHGIPVVHTLHDYYLLCARSSLTRRDGSACEPSPVLCGLRTRRLGRWAPAVAAVIGVSCFIVRRHEALFPDAARHVVRHPVTPQDGEPVPPPGDRLATLGYLGSLDRVKGVDLLLEAAGELERAGCRVRIAGNGRLREEVERAPGVEYVGIVGGEAKRDFLAGCDAGVVPSVWDEPGGPPYTLVEWLAAGRPVLASRGGGLGEAVDELPGAIGIEPTAAGIVSAVRELRQPEAWRSAVAAVGPIGSPDDLDRWLDDHERVYREASRGASRE
jgi:glycosyltransferase involved in cell wall biosynthesis